MELVLVPFTPLVATGVGLMVGAGLSPLAGLLPKTARIPPAEDGLYVRLKRRPLWLALANALIYALVWWSGRPPVVALFLSLYASILLLIAVIDLETRLIPDALIYPAILLALGGSLVDPRLTWQSALLGGVLGFVIFYAVAWITRGGISGGDVKLATFIGSVAGFPAVLSALVVGILAGGIVSLLLLATGRATRRTFIPYGPFLCLGGVYALLWGQVAF